MIANISNKVLGVIKRSAGTGNVTIFSMVYKSPAWSILEFCSTSLEPLRGDGYLYREASISDHRTYLSLVECYKVSFVKIILTLKIFF